jgi:hypothetical protein
MLGPFVIPAKSGNPGTVVQQLPWPPVFAGVTTS